MKNNDFFLSYQAFTVEESKMTLSTTDGQFIVAEYSEDEYSWKLGQLIPELESFNQHLQVAVKGHVQLIDGVVENLKFNLGNDLGGMAQRIFITSHDKKMTMQNLVFEKIVHDDFMQELNDLRSYLTKVLESPAFNDFKIDSDSILSTWRNCNEVLKWYLNFQDYDKEFQRISAKISAIQGNSEEMSQNKENFEENYKILRSAQIVSGMMLSDDFRMSKDNVINLMGKRYSSFGDLINALS